MIKGSDKAAELKLPVIIQPFKKINKKRFG
jgi:hypothetical protein